MGKFIARLSEFMEVYFEDKQIELKERTMKNKRYMMEQHIIPYFGNQMMSEITVGQIIQWQNEMQTKGFAEAYLRMIQNQLTSGKLPFDYYKEIIGAYRNRVETMDIAKLEEYAAKFKHSDVSDFFISCIGKKVRFSQ